MLKSGAELIVDRANRGQVTMIIKVKSHISIHGNETADMPANEAAEKCTKSRRYDISQKFSDFLMGKLW